MGKNVTGFAPGDLVVSTVRRPCGDCPNCEVGENDTCCSDKYQERGIMKRHGFMAEYYVETAPYLHKIRKEVEAFAVLLEPMSVVEKGIDHAFLLQRRLTWKPKLAVVLGALSHLVTNRIPWQDYKTWFTQRGGGIKSTLEIGG